MNLLDWIRGVTKEDKLLKHAKNGNNEKISIKLEDGANPNVYDNEGLTPLHYTISQGNLWGTRLLLNAGANIQFKNGEGHSALDFIVKYPYYETSNEELDKQGTTALMYAAKSGNVSVARQLLASYTDYTKRDKSGNTAFLLALKNHHKHTANEIRKNLNKEISVKKAYTIWKDVKVLKQKWVTEEEEQPVYKTVQEPYQELVGGVVSTPDGYKTVGGYVTKYRDVKKFSHNKTVEVERLKSYYTLEKRPFTEHKWERAKVPGADALFSANSNLRKTILSWGVEPNRTNDRGNSLLHHSVKNSEEELMRLLISYGANTNIANKNKNTPLHWAAIFGNLSQAKILLKSEANPNIQNREGLTPLHIAAKRNDSALVKLLLERGAKVELQSKEGKTALDMADRDCRKILQAISKHPLQRTLKIDTRQNNTIF